MLHQEELQVVFGNVAKLYGRAIAEAFLQLPAQVTPRRPALSPISMQQLWFKSEQAACPAVAQQVTC